MDSVAREILSEADVIEGEHFDEWKRGSPGIDRDLREIESNESRR